MGGSIVTQIISAVMVFASGAVGYVMMQAYGSATPEQYFPAFIGLFIVLFFASGIGNGSTFRTIGVIFDRQQAGPVLGWTSAVAAYGAFIAPVVIGAQIKAGTPQFAMYGFAIFYAVMPGAELVVLPAQGRGDQEPMKTLLGSFCSGLRPAWRSASSVSPALRAPPLPTEAERHTESANGVDAPRASVTSPRRQPRAVGCTVPGGKGGAHAVGGGHGRNRAPR